MENKKRTPKQVRAGQRNWTYMHLTGMMTVIHERVKHHEDTSTPMQIYLTHDELVALKLIRGYLDTLYRNWKYNSQDLGMKVGRLPKLSTSDIDLTQELPDDRPRYFDVNKPFIFSGLDESPLDLTGRFSNTGGDQGFGGQFKDDLPTEGEDI